MIEKQMKRRHGHYFLIAIVILITILVFIVTAFPIIVTSNIYSPYALTAMCLVQTNWTFISPLFWMALLFIPYGLLFDSIWGDKRARLFHSFISAFLLMLIHHLAWYWINRNWNFMMEIPTGAGFGALMGCSIHSMWNAFKKKYQKSGQSPRKKRILISNITDTMALLFALIIFIGSSLLQLSTPYGFIRNCNLKFPPDTKLSCVVQDLPEQMPVYRKEVVDIDAMARSFAQAFQCDNIIIEDELSFYGKIEENNLPYVGISRGDITGVARYVYTGDSINESSQAAPASQDEALAMAQQKLAFFLRDGESLEILESDCATEHKDSITMRFQVKPAEEAQIKYLSNEINITIKHDRIVYLDLQVNRMDATELVKTLPAMSVIRFGRYCGAEEFDYLGRRFQISEIIQDDIYYQGKKCMIPSYRISGTYTDFYGDDKEWNTTIDAVDRGILPYIIPGGVLIVLLAALVIAVRRKNAGRKGQVLTIEDSLDGKAEVQRQMDEQTDMKKN